MSVEPRKLRSQLLAWLFIPLLPLLAVGTLVGYWVSEGLSTRVHDRALMEVARELSLYLRRDPTGIALVLPAPARKLLLEDPIDETVYEVGSLDGRHLEGMPLPAAPEPDLRGDSAVFYAADFRGKPVRVVELRATGDVESGRPAALLRVAESMAKRSRHTREILLSVLLPQALIVLVAAAVVWVGVVRGLSPLERVRRQLEGRAPGDWSPMQAHDVPAEVKPLLDSINELVGRLDNALSLQARFTADAAHQLKTPVTVIKTELELALRESDPERVRQALFNTRAGVERLSRVVSQLLSLARNEPQAALAIALVPTDLNALTLDVTQAWVPEALKKGIDLGLEPSQRPLVIRGDGVRLREMLDNLLDNAVRYSPDGGQVTVRVASDPVPAVEVSDDGPRIPPAERARVFERFHRLLGNDQEGSGLGLAIAQEIARIHGATITLLDDADGTGNCFRVTFPTAS